MTVVAIQSGFCKTGIFPVKRNAINCRPLQANAEMQERQKGDVGPKRGSSHKGGDLNSWKESNMQNAWDEYTE